MNPIEALFNTVIEAKAEDERLAKRAALINEEREIRNVLNGLFNTTEFTDINPVQKRFNSATCRCCKSANNSVYIERVIFNEPATIVYWSDDTKTVVKCREDDTFSKETGLAMAIAKKACGNTSSFNEIFKQYAYDEDIKETVVDNPTEDCSKTE